MSEQKLKLSLTRNGFFLKSSNGKALIYFTKNLHDAFLVRLVLSHRAGV